MKREKLFEIFLIFIIFILIIIIILNTPIINRYSNQEKLIINEVLSSNKNTLVDIDGIKQDYIELYNGNDYSINLKGYYLSDDSFNLKKWQFPDVEIGPKSYLTVYASGKDKYDSGEIHTNFKLSKKGEVITLSNTKAKPISRIYYLETLEDTSYGYNGSEYVYFYTPNICLDQLSQK